MRSFCYSAYAGSHSGPPRCSSSSRAFIAVRAARRSAISASKSRIALSVPPPLPSGRDPVVGSGVERTDLVRCSSSSLHASSARLGGFGDLSEATDGDVGMRLGMATRSAVCVLPSGLGMPDDRLAIGPGLLSRCVAVPSWNRSGASEAVETMDCTKDARSPSP